MNHFFCKKYDDSLDLDGLEDNTINSVPEDLQPTETMLNDMRQHFEDEDIMYVIK